MKTRTDPDKQTPIHNYDPKFFCTDSVPVTFHGTALLEKTVQAAALPKEELARQYLAAKKLVLIVDDNIQLRDVMISRLPKDGVKYDGAWCVDEAAEKINFAHSIGRAYDFIGLDLAMPRKEGTALLNMFREKLGNFGSVEEAKGYFANEGIQIPPDALAKIEALSGATVYRDLLDIRITDRLKAWEGLSVSFFSGGKNYVVTKSKEGAYHAFRDKEEFAGTYVAAISAILDSAESALSNGANAAYIKPIMPNGLGKICRAALYGEEGQA